MYKKILNFWFEELSHKQHFIVDKKVDQEIKQRFSNLHSQAINGELFAWRQSPYGRLAEIIILDQFSRNLYRQLPQAFSYDLSALILAQEAISLGADINS